MTGRSIGTLPERRRPSEQTGLDMDIFKIENTFYLQAHPNRLSKFLAHAKLYEMSLGLPGHFAELGVFRGASFMRFRKLARLFHPDHARKFIGFDVFGKFPAVDFAPDDRILSEQRKEYGDVGISRDQLMELLQAQHLADNVELVAGDIRETLPAYLDARQEMSFAFVNIDVDLYEATKVALELMYPRVVSGGVIAVDDYEGFPGAKKAIDEFLEQHGRGERIRKFPFALSPCHLIKDDGGQS